MEVVCICKTLEHIYQTAQHFVFLRCLHWLLVTANTVCSLPILVTLMIEALSSSETSVLTRATQCNIPEDAILLCTVLYSRRQWSWYMGLLCNNTLSTLGYCSGSEHQALFGHCSLSCLVPPNECWSSNTSDLCAGGVQFNCLPAHLSIPT
jgi:hypothetical protein